MAGAQDIQLRRGILHSSLPSKQPPPTTSNHFQPPTCVIFLKPALQPSSSFPSGLKMAFTQSERVHGGTGEEG